MAKRRPLPQQSKPSIQRHPITPPKRMQPSFSAGTPTYQQCLSIAEAENMTYQEVIERAVFLLDLLYRGGLTLSLSSQSTNVPQNVEHVKNLSKAVI